MPKFRINTYHLKLIALVFMVIDHIGLYLIPSDTAAYGICRIIGRSSAPIFWYCFTVGLRHSRNPWRYIERLFIASYVMAVGNGVLSKITGCSLTMSKPNIFLTLAMIGTTIKWLEALVLEEYRMSMSETILHAFVPLVIWLAVGFRMEYGWYAAIIIPLMYFAPDIRKLSVWYIVASIGISVITHNTLQVFMVMAVVFMLLDSGEKPKVGKDGGKRRKRFFYVFYPVHIWIFALIGCLMQ